jgi:hypothetical protein
VSRIKQSKNNDCLTLEDGTDRLFRNASINDQSTLCNIPVRNFLTNSATVSFSRETLFGVNEIINLTEPVERKFSLEAGSFAGI